MHWFNPPEWTPGIEVIAGAATDRAVVERVLEFLKDVGKQPAEVADRAGFVSNRLQMALLREALAIVAEGQTTREDLDTIVRSTFGFRLPFFGPFQIADMAGLDTYVGVYKTLERDVGPEFAPPEELVALVDAGRVGAKAGAGFEEYSEEERDRLLLERDRRYAALARLLARMIDASVLVVGGGAIGGVTAAKLTGAVRRVVVLDASEEHVARLNDGLKLDELGEERTVQIEAVTEPPDEAFDFILVTLKAAHHEAVKPLKGDVREPRQRARAGAVGTLVGRGNLISGIVEWGATNLGPGHLAQTTAGPFVVGPPATTARGGWPKSSRRPARCAWRRTSAASSGRSCSSTACSAGSVRSRGRPMRRWSQPDRQGCRAAHVARGLRGRPRAGPPPRQGPRRRGGGARRGRHGGPGHRHGGPRRHLRLDAPGPGARRAHRGRRDRRRGRREGPGTRHSDPAARARDGADPRR